MNADPHLQAYNFPRATAEDRYAIGGGCVHRPRLPPVRHVQFRGYLVTLRYVHHRGVLFAQPSSPSDVHNCALTYHHTT